MSTQRTFDRTHPLGRDDLARLVAEDIPPGSYLNLGIGQPTRVADFLEPGSGVILHTENGMLGVGPQAYGDDIDPDLINAGKTPVTEMRRPCRAAEDPLPRRLIGGRLLCCRP